MNQKSIITALFGAFSLVSAQAGTSYVQVDSGKSIAPPARIEVPTLCQCFEPNTASVSIYAAGLLPDSDGGLDDSFGGGLAVDYFFSENVGIQVDATWADADSVVHLFTGSVVLRYPIKSICLAPFIFGGGGVHTDGVTQGVFHAGGGLDYRFNDKVGIFADARYTWTEETEEYALVRTGVRFAF